MISQTRWLASRRSVRPTTDQCTIGRQPRRRFGIGSAGLTTAVVLTLTSATPMAHAQFDEPFDPADFISDPAGFATVINLPADQAFIESIDADTQVNVFEGGSLGPCLDQTVFGSEDGSTAGAELNVFGGTIQTSVSLRPGVATTLAGGVWNSFFPLIGLPRFEITPGSDVRFVGSEFRLNGEPYTGEDITLLETGVFTGTFADGTPFVLSPWPNFEDLLAPGGVLFGDHIDRPNSYGCRCRRRTPRRS